MSERALILTARSTLDEALADAKQLRAAADKLAAKLENLIARGYELSRALPEAADQTETAPEDQEEGGEG